MGLSELVFGCVLHILAGGDPLVCQDLGVAQEAAQAIAQESYDTGVPAEIIAAVIYHESGFRMSARGKAGEVGLCQILRKGAIQGHYLKLTNRQLERVDLNIHIGAQYLLYSKSGCNGPPVYYLSVYNGNSCVPTTYSRTVLRKLAVVKRKYHLPRAI